MNFQIVSCDHSRLLELGLTEGSQVSVTDLGWFGKVIGVRGALIGIRNSDMHFIKLQKTS